MCCGGEPGPGLDLSIDGLAAVAAAAGPAAPGSPHWAPGRRCRAPPAGSAGAAPRRAGPSRRPPASPPRRAVAGARARPLARVPPLAPRRRGRCRPPLPPCGPWTWGSRPGHLRLGVRLARGGPGRGWSPRPWRDLVCVSIRCGLGPRPADAAPVREPPGHELPFQADVLGRPHRLRAGREPHERGVLLSRCREDPWSAGRRSAPGDVVPLGHLVSRLRCRVAARRDRPGAGGRNPALVDATRAGDPLDDQGGRQVGRHVAGAVGQGEQVSRAAGGATRGRGVGAELGEWLDTRRAGSGPGDLAAHGGAEEAVRLARPLVRPPGGVGVGACHRSGRSSARWRRPRSRSAPRGAATWSRRRRAPGRPSARSSGRGAAGGGRSRRPRAPPQR